MRSEQAPVYIDLFLGGILVWGLRFLFLTTLSCTISFYKLSTTFQYRRILHRHGRGYKILLDYEKKGKCKYTRVTCKTYDTGWDVEIHTYIQTREKVEILMAEYFNRCSIGFSFAKDQNILHLYSYRMAVRDPIIIFTKLNPRRAVKTF